MPPDTTPPNTETDPRSPGTTEPRAPRSPARTSRATSWGARAHNGLAARHTLSVPEQRCLKIRRAVVGAVAAYPSAEVFVLYPFRGKRMIGRAGTCRAIVVNPARWNVEAYLVPVVLGETLASNG
jgi:hypothetical protein